MRLPVIIINDCWEYIIEVEVEVEVEESLGLDRVMTVCVVQSGQCNSFLILHSE